MGSALCCCLRTCLHFHNRVGVRVDWGPAKLGNASSLWINSLNPWGSDSTSANAMQPTLMDFDGLSQNHGATSTTRCEFWTSTTRGFGSAGPLLLRFPLAPLLLRWDGRAPRGDGLKLVGEPCVGPMGPELAGQRGFLGFLSIQHDTLQDTPIS